MGMEKLVIQDAVRYQKKARVALYGPSGSGKTLTGLYIANGLRGDGKIALLDTERGSASLYAEEVDFKTVIMPDFDYDTFLAGIELVEKGGFTVGVIDSISHAWEAFLEMHELEVSRVKNSYTAWAKVTPRYNELMNAIMRSPIHWVVTMRSKSDVVLEERNGKQVPKKVGLAPIMRPGSEYEFDVVGAIDIDHNMAIEKTRMKWLADKIIKKPGAELGKEIKTWLDGGKAVEAPKPVELSVPKAVKEDKFWLDEMQEEAKKRTQWLYDLTPYIAANGQKWPSIRTKLLDKGCVCPDKEKQVWVCPLEIKGFYAYELEQPTAE